MVIVMIKLLIDVLIASFTSFNTYFFLLNIHEKRSLYLFFLGILIDCYVLHRFFYTTICLLLAKFFQKHLKINYYNMVNYFLFYIFFVVGYYMVYSLCLGVFSVNILFKTFLVNLLFIYASYKKYLNNIKLFG